MVAEPTIEGDPCRCVDLQSCPQSYVAKIVVQTLSGFEVWLDRESHAPSHNCSSSLIYPFTVVAPCGETAIVSVEIPASLQETTRHALGPRFTDDPAFWYHIAEDSLCNALDERGNLPDDLQFTVHQLTYSQEDAARRWHSKGDCPG